MPKINRSDTFYVKLPESLATKTIPDAKLQISLNVTHPKGMEKVTQKVIIEVTDEARKIFKKKFKREIERMSEND